MAAIIAIGLATSGWSACSLASPHLQMHVRVAACDSPADGSAK